MNAESMGCAEAGKRSCAGKGGRGAGWAVEVVELGVDTVACVSQDSSVTSMWLCESYKR